MPKPKHTKPPISEPQRSGYALTFRDEFDTLDWTRWGRHRFDTSDLASHYEADNSHGNYLVSDSCLTLRAKYEPTGLPNGKVWSSGELDLGGSHLQTYGYWEARVKVPGGQGVWPAVWMMPDPTLVPNNPAEIDILESIGDASHYIANYHWAYNTQATGTTQVTVTPDQFHVLGLSWEQDLLIWYVDDVEVKRYASTNVYRESMYLILNLAIGAEGSWPGSWDATTPTQVDFVIDWVRIWRRV